MEYEIIDAIESYYKGDIEIQKDIVMWLKKFSKSAVLDDWLETNGFCPNCGSELDVIEVKEYHPEVDFDNTEYLYFKTCPKCDY